MTELLAIEKMPLGIPNTIAYKIVGCNKHTKFTFEFVIKIFTAVMFITPKMMRGRVRRKINLPRPI